MIETQPFGRTGHISTRLIFGGAAFSSVTQAEADRTLDLLLQYGINHIDTAASYGDSELRIGPWMARHRKDFFLATKTGERTYQRPATRSTARWSACGSTSVDLIQLHYLVDPERVGSGDGAGRRAGGRDRGPRAGAGALHRRDRPRADRGRHAPAQPGALRLRLGAAALQLRA